jgi:hypothetical protein
MASATIDHMVSLIVFIGALLIFIGLFSQSIQTANVYERHRALSTKTSDLLDTMLLNPGVPANWGQSNSDVTGFGVQDPEFTQYQISPFSLMRLEASNGNILECDKSSPNIYYDDESLGSGSTLLIPVDQALNYSSALTILGIKNTYGFQLTFTPDITVSITENQASSPLSLTLSATGTGFPFAYATVNYCLIQAKLPQSQAEYPAYTIQSGDVTTDQQGIANISFPSITDPNQVYAFVAYAHLNGVLGVGYHTRTSSNDQYVVPIVQNMATQQIALAHNFDLNGTGPEGSSLKYNATFVILKQDFTLSELSFGAPGNLSLVGTVTSGRGNPSPNVFLPPTTTGILIVTYQLSPTQGGIVMMPWGISSLAFPVTFGGNPQGQEWVTTDLRQVTIGGVAYQVKLELWDTTGQQVTT